MTAKEVLKELEGYADENTKKTFLRHGAKEPLFGVKVQDLKKILKKTKKNHALSLELYATGNSDAMYLAGLMADEKKISKAELQKWVKEASWSMISDFTVPWVASETAYGFELGMEWIDSKEEHIASSGWATLSSFAAVNEDEYLDFAAYSKLLDRVEQKIHSAPNGVRSAMNAFIIAIGCYIEELTDKANEVALRIGKVKVDMGDTACKVPYAVDYIKKVVDKGNAGKKRKSARC